MKQITIFIFSLIILSSLVSSLNLSVELLSFDNYVAPINDLSTPYFATNQNITNFTQAFSNSIYLQGQGFFTTTHLDLQSGDTNVPITNVRIYLHNLVIKEPWLPSVNQSGTRGKEFLENIKPGIYSKQMFQKINPYHNTLAQMFPEHWNINGILYESEIQNPNPSYALLTNSPYVFVRRLFAAIHPPYVPTPLSGKFVYNNKGYKFKSVSGTINSDLKDQFLFKNAFFPLPSQPNVMMMIPPGNYTMYAVAEINQGEYYLISQQVPLRIEAG